MIGSMIFYRKNDIKTARREYKAIIGGRNLEGIASSSGPDRTARQTAEALFAMQPVTAGEKPLHPEKTKEKKLTPSQEESLARTEMLLQKKKENMKEEMLQVEFNDQEEKTEPLTEALQVTEVLKDDSGSTEFLDELEETEVLEDNTILLKETER